MGRVFNEDDSMMRRSLHLITERRRHRAAATALQRRQSGTGHARTERAAPERDETPPVGSQKPTRRANDTPPLDIDSERVREFGGPVDQAQYSCDCGYVFDAAVSTTVACPHCGSSQAW